MANTNTLLTTFGTLTKGFEQFTKASARFSWAMAVFAVHQGGSIFKGLPTSDPTANATADFNKVSDTVVGTFDNVDNTLFNTPNTVQQASIGLAFNLLQPSNYAPKTVAETTNNVVRWGIGLATQLIPGGVVGTGGPPEGWGPVNREDAELF